jgi:hypothetical protein
MKIQNIVLAPVLYIILLFSCGKGLGGAYAQQYIPFPTDSAQWSVRNCFYSSQACASFQHKMKGDTLLNGKTYSKIYYSDDLTYGSQNQTLHCFVREDTAKKVFIKYPTGTGIDTAEFLLYDFNVEVGDTVTIKLLYPNDSLFELLVISIDSNQFLTGYRKSIGLEPLGVSMWGGGVIKLLVGQWEWDVISEACYIMNFL